MRKFIPALVVGCCVVLWEAILQFSTVQTTLAALRSSGPTGSFIAKFLTSQVVILSLAVAAILLALRGIVAMRKSKDFSVSADRVTIKQTMTDSPNSIQAGRDVKR
jgi:hypothetical protein